jgi:aryl-alcohol dehydrogenase-like predicted oxidoreductase
MSLRRLQVERIDLYYLHRIDPAVPLEDQLGVLRDMQVEGKIYQIGLSKVTLEQLRTASTLTAIAAVSNKYNIIDRTSEDVLRHCELHSIPFVPYAPLAAGALTTLDALSQIAENYGVTPSQLALAWLLHRSPVVRPIPGTRSSTHLHENLAAQEVILTSEAMTVIESATTNAEQADRGRR